MRPILICRRSLKSHPAPATSLMRAQKGTSALQASASRVQAIAVLVLAAPLNPQARDWSNRSLNCNQKVSKHYGTLVKRTLQRGP